MRKNEKERRITMEIIEKTRVESVVFASLPLVISDMICYYKEARSQKPEARSQKPEARSQKPEARS
jgi:hypothetical protein